MIFNIQNEAIIDTITVLKVSGKKFVDSTITFVYKKEDLLLFYSEIEQFKQSYVYDFSHNSLGRVKFEDRTADAKYTPQNVAETDSDYRVTVRFYYQLEESVQFSEIIHRQYIKKDYIESLYTGAGQDYELPQYESIVVIEKSEPTEHVQDFSEFDQLSAERFQPTLKIEDVAIDSVIGNTLSQQFISDLFISHRVDKVYSYFIVDCDSFAKNHWMFPKFTTNLIQDFNTTTQIVIIDIRTGKTAEVEKFDKNGKVLYRFALEESKDFEREVKVDFFMSDPTRNNMKYFIETLKAVVLAYNDKDYEKASLFLDDERVKLFFGKTVNSLKAGLLNKNREIVIDYINKYINYIETTYSEVLSDDMSRNNPYSTTGRSKSGKTQTYFSKSYKIGRQPKSHVSPVFMADGRIKKSDLINALNDNTKAIFGVDNGNFSLSNMLSYELSESKYYYTNLDVSDCYNNMEFDGNRFHNLYDLFISVLDGNNDLSTNKKYYDFLFKAGVGISLEKKVEKPVLGDFFFEANKPKEQNKQNAQNDTVDLSVSMLQMILVQFLKEDLHYFDSNIYNMFLKEKVDSEVSKFNINGLALATNKLFGIDSDGTTNIPNSIKFLSSQFSTTKPKNSISIFTDNNGFIKSFMYPIFFFKFLYSFRIEYMEFDSGINNGLWKPLTLNEITNGNKLLCRITYYDDPLFVPRQILEKFKFPIYNQYFMVE